MTTVEGGNGQDVHEGEDDAEEGCHLPEHIPVPVGREQVANGSEATNRLSTLGAEDVFQVVDIGRQYIPSVFDACGETLEEAILDGHRFIETCQRLHHIAQLKVAGEHHISRILLGDERRCTLIDDGDSSCLQTVGQCRCSSHHISPMSQEVGEFVVRVNG